jgi:hypothetical protein
LPFNDKRRADPPKKNHAKKPTVGFWCFDAYDRIFNVRLEKDRQGSEGEVVVRQVNCNRKGTQIAANLDRGRLAAPKRWDADIVCRSALKEGSGECGVPQDADHGGRTVRIIQERPARGADRAPQRIGLRTWVSKDGSTFISRKSLIFNPKLRKSLISKPSLTQVVDFHDIFRYFQLFPMLFWIRLAERRRRRRKARRPEIVE